jgi:hypothetical protein
MPASSRDTPADQNAVAPTPMAPPAATKEKSAPLRLQMMLTFLLFSIAVFLCTLHFDANFEGAIRHKIAALRAPLRGDRYVKFRVKDPPLYAEMPDNPVGANVRKSAVPSQGGYLVVYVGDCASCLALNVKKLEQKAAELHVSMVLLTATSSKNAEIFRHQSHCVSPAIPDPQGLLLGPVNAAWPGRCYLFSNQWKLLWLSQEPLPDFEMVSVPSFMQALQRVQE